MKLDNVRKKLQLYRTLLFLGTSTLGISTTVLTTIKKELETVVKVSEDIRTNIYKQNILKIDEYLDEYETNINEDKYITKELLESLENLSLDMALNDNLNVLDNCPNLKTIDIKSAELLTEEDIIKINESKITNLFLSFDYNNVAKIRENKFDLQKFENKNIKIRLRYTNGYSELNFLILFNYLKNYDENMFENQDQKTYENYKELDNTLNKIIEGINLDNSKNDIEKTLLISDYICNNIQYDKDVSNYLNATKEDEKEKLKVNFAHKTLLYNYSEISSIFMDENKEQATGICLNYAALFDILCYKAGVESRLITAKGKEGVGHAWNIVYLEDYTKYVDLTFFDNTVNEFYLSCYSGNDNGFHSKEYYYDLLVNTIFENNDDAYKDYILIEKIENLNKLLEKEDIYYYNEEIEGKKVLNEKNEAVKTIVLGLIAEMFVVSFSKKSRNRVKELTKI